MSMKKLLIIVGATCMLHVNFTQGMIDYTYSLIDLGLNYVEKYRRPIDYVNSPKNIKLYQSVLTAINDKSIEHLQDAQFPDKNNVLHTFENTLKKRIAERLSKLIECIIDQSLIQAPREQKNIDLSEMIQGNRLIIPDLYLALALRALQEQTKKDNIKVPNTGSKIVDVFLYKFSLLDENDKTLLKRILVGEDEQVALDQQRKLAEAYLFSLSPEEQENLLQKVSKKKPISSPVQINHNASNRSLATTPTQTLDVNGQDDLLSQKRKKRMALVPNNNSNEHNILNVDNGSYDGGNVIEENKLPNAHKELVPEPIDGDVY